MLAGIIATVLIWIHYSQRLRNAVHPRQVMVGDDQVHSGAPRRFGCGKPADASVHTDDQPHAVGSSALDDLVAHPIAFADAVRYVKVSRSAAQLDRRLENDDRRRAIHVVVAVNQNFLFALYRRFQPIKRSFHPAHPQRVVKVGKLRRKKTHSRFRFVNPTPDEQIGKHRQSRRRDFQSGIMQRSFEHPGFRRIQRIGNPSHGAGLRRQVSGVREFLKLIDRTVFLRPETWHLRPALSFFVLVRLIDHESAAIIRQFAEVLIMLVPFGASFINEDASLVRPSQLHEPGLSDVGLQPAAFFQIFFASVVAVGEPLGQALQLFAIERPGMHGQEGGARGLGQFHEILPAIRIMFRIPQHAGDFFALDIAKETAHAQTFNEGRHIVFHACQVVWMWRHGVSSLYGVALVTRHCDKQMPWFSPVNVFPL